MLFRSMPDVDQWTAAALRTPTAHFSELLGLSIYLSGSLHDENAARETFERGYAEFWRTGHDPRLIGSPLLRLLNPPLSPRTSIKVQEELATRAYLTSPYADGAADAWKIYAATLRSHDMAEQAAVWDQRSDEARRKTVTLPDQSSLLLAARADLVATGFLIAAPVYFVEIGRAHV